MRNETRNEQTATASDTVSLASPSRVAQKERETTMPNEEKNAIDAIANSVAQRAKNSALQMIDKLDEIRKRDGGDLYPNVRDAREAVVDEDVAFEEETGVQRETTIRWICVSPIGPMLVKNSS